jgi:uncharacterized protein
MNLHYDTPMNRRTFLRNLVLGGLSIPPLSLGGAYAQAMSFQISKHQVKLKHLEQPVRIAHLTDLHYGGAHGIEHVKAWVKATLEQRPDVVVITGDLVHGDAFRKYGKNGYAMLEQFALALEPLASVPLGAYASLGNHDYALRWSGAAEVSDLIRNLNQYGISMLINTGKTLRPDLYLGGVDDYWLGTVNSRAAIANAKQNQAVLLMSHNPDILPLLESRVGLMLSGHTHGGQVRIPGIGALASVTKYGERYQQGFIQEAALGFVSRGLGSGDIPIRVFCPAELVILECQPT